MIINRAIQLVPSHIFDCTQLYYYYYYYYYYLLAIKKNAIYELM